MPLRGSFGTRRMSEFQFSSILEGAQITADKWMSMPTKIKVTVLPTLHELEEDLDSKECVYEVKSNSICKR